MSIPIALVAAVAQNRVIGRDNGLPWRLSSDLKRFKEVTIGKPLIVGRKNHEAIGRPLPGRETIVMTRDRGYAPAGVHVAHDVADAIGLAEALAEEMGADEIICAGGGEVYQLFMAKAVRLRLTEVEAEPEGDVLFPPFDDAHWREVFSERHARGPRDEYAFTYRDLVRIRSG
ncbi:dihydrofolate reductase [Methylopila sp. M107]|uniref:dihydrofolate reductase n=1 Tax=Methylopila sp. M107 TaxID=1101190 RepID=UPI00037ECC91|nr:dihydrofolate reductase [Methylopila sp. M107]